MQKTLPITAETLPHISNGELLAYTRRNALDKETTAAIEQELQRRAQIETANVRNGACPCCGQRYRRTAPRLINRFATATKGDC